MQWINEYALKEQNGNFTSKVKFVDQSPPDEIKEITESVFII